jgi:hypothetical protein
MLAATGFKPDLPAQSLAIMPTVPRDFHAPWVSAAGFGRVSRKGTRLTIGCQAGALWFKTLKENLRNANPRVQLTDHPLDFRASHESGITTIEFRNIVSIKAGQSCSIE